MAHYDALAAKEWPVVSEERMVPTSYGQTFVRITGPTQVVPGDQILIGMRLLRVDG